MFLRKTTMTSTMDYSQAIERIRQELDRVEAVVIGAGAGLSTSAGLEYTDKRFRENFTDFIAKYRIQDMYSAGFHPYRTLEEYWAYWSRHIFLNRYEFKPGVVHRNLLDLVENKDYFVITTNVDHLFQKAGFDKTRLFYTQGDYGLWQCSKPCHKENYDNEETVRRMIVAQEDMRVPTELIPHCPKCGRPMTNNLRCDGTFVQDEGWHAAAKRYEDFLTGHDGQRVLYLELGVGGNTPVIIKYPFRLMTRNDKNAVYACVNLNDANAPCEIAERSVCIREDIGRVLSALI